MRITDLTGAPEIINEGYKLTYHEIMALFDVIEKGRYMPTDRRVDKLNKAKDKTTKAVSGAASAIGGAAKSVGGFMSGVAKNVGNRNSGNPDRIEPTMPESVIYEAGFSIDKAKKWATRELNPKKPVISANDLVKMWKDLGSPTDSSDIIRMLVHDVQMPREMVLQAIKTASMQDPNVMKFAEIVKQQGLTKQILAKCDAILMDNDITDRESQKRNIDSRYKERNARRRERQLSGYGSFESVENDKPMISEASVIDDSDIRDIITKIATIKVQSGGAVGGTEEYVKKWADKIKAQTDAVAKMNLVKEIVNYLAGVHGTDEWKKVVHGVDNIIKTDQTISNFTKDSEDKNDDQFVSIATANLANGKKMENKMFLMTNDILTEAGVSWTDISLKPSLTSNGIMIHQTIKGTNMPVKQFVTEMTMNKLNKQINTIGRIKKL